MLDQAVGVEEQVVSQQVYSGRLLQVYRDVVRLANGNLTTREYIKHPGAAVVIPYLGNRQIVMLQQYRYPVQLVMLELPAGKIDPGEQPLDTIQREITEEIGYRAKLWQKVGLIHTCVGYSDELIHLYWASELQPCQGHQDEDEALHPFIISIDEAMKLIYAGKITDAKTLIGLFYADKILNAGLLHDQIQI
jgi:ADP-ribose pyrophosphatase